MTGPLQRGLRALGWTVITLAVLALLLGAAVLRFVRPGERDWAHTVAWGPFERPVGVAALWSLATHPIALRLGAGRVWETPFGPVRWFDIDPCYVFHVANAKMIISF